MFTPESVTAWVLVATLVLCLLIGVAMTSASVRTTWIRKNITTAIVIYGLLGVVLLTTPKWTTIAFEWGEVKARVAELESENAQLVADNSKFKDQINTVSSLGTTKYPTAEDAVIGIKNARDTVDWAADFLPASDASYQIEVAPEDATFALDLAKKFNTSPSEVSKVFETGGYTVLKKPTANELKSSPPNLLWVTPKKQ
ncbi:hypothetical protein [Phyllobacterium zundukense]|uniref:Uncharacterized protein n=1 Tax=Phyllobacterium zundukense TaxID=1867719 RepID=A0A2N9W4V6_9HYPH|nr:hypothetical protein [Phyllobacterium zundukense]ATU91760.1 hypothetical protein BLM14_09110 [Phyllobacterium zundukense]PIO46774.1 hypothetical protein B5P45_02965 [Phyllobacterium zundukense]